jgi:hypothetical protein
MTIDIEDLSAKSIKSHEDPLNLGINHPYFIISAGEAMPIFE